MLVPLKRSAEYGRIRPRVANLLPIDSWQIGEHNYFVFELRPDEGASAGGPVPAALFQVSWEQYEPLTAVVIRSGTAAGQVDVEDLRIPGHRYSLPLPSTSGDTPPEH